MIAAAEAKQFEAAARLRDQLTTVHQLQEKQRIATAEQSDDADVFGYHFEDGASPSTSSTCAAARSSTAANSSGKTFPNCWKQSASQESAYIEESGAPGLDPQSVEPSAESIGASSKAKSPAGSVTPVFDPGIVFSALLKQLYIDQHYVPRSILVPVDFPDRQALADLLS